MDRKNSAKLLLYLFLIIAILAPRLPALDSFSTLDEPYWLSMGANFYYALGQREFQNTVYEYQPAVTTMWIVTAAMAAYFPEYRGLGQGYLDYEKGTLDPFMLEHGKDPLTLLHNARMIQIIIVTILFLLLFFLLQKIVPTAIALFTVLFASFDPFFLSQSRLLDHEAMLSLFVVTSLLSFSLYLTQERKVTYLVLSGALAGFAQLTKSSAIAMLVPLGIMLLIQVFQERENGIFNAFWKNTKIFAAWILVLAVTYFIFWPGMWVAPGKMLYEVYGNAFSYAFQGARLKVTGDLETASSGLNMNFSGTLDLLNVILWRTTPFTWLGVLLGFTLPFTRDLKLVQPYRQLSTLYLFTAAAFILMIGIAQGRNSPHYILASFLALNLFAGLGWYQATQWLMNAKLITNKQLGQVITLSVLVLVQVVSAVSFFPYYFTYRNPILYSLGEHRDFPPFPYGEGLELAGKYLAGLPNAKDSIVLSYYARGCFSYFYPGESTRFKPYFVDAEHKSDLEHSIRSANYLVIYYANQGQMDKYFPLLDALSAATPIHEIWLNDYKYVMIYQVDTLPPSFFEAISK